MRRLSKYSIAGLAAAGVTAVSAAVAFVALDEARWDRAGAFVAGLIPQPAISSSLTVQTVTVEGRERTDRGDLLSALDVEYGTEIRGVDVLGAKSRLEDLPWIETAVVERRLPDTIHVAITERHAFASWQMGDQFRLIDAAGKPILTVDRPPEDLPLFVGPGAGEKGQSLLAELAGEPALAQRVVAAVRISKRRWDIHLDDRRDGSVIRLPADQMQDAWHKLAVLDRRYEITRRGVRVVDLRVPGQLIVTLKSGETLKGPDDLRTANFIPVRGEPG